MASVMNFCRGAQSREQILNVRRFEIIQRKAKCTLKRGNLFCFSAGWQKCHPCEHQKLLLLLFKIFPRCFLINAHGTVCVGEDSFPAPLSKNRENSGASNAAVAHQVKFPLRGYIIQECHKSVQYLDDQGAKAPSSFSLTPSARRDDFPIMHE